MNGVIKRATAPRPHACVRIYGQHRVGWCAAPRGFVGGSLTLAGRCSLGLVRVPPPVVEYSSILGWLAGTTEWPDGAGDAGSGWSRFGRLMMAGDSPFQIYSLCFHSLCKVSTLFYTKYPTSLQCFQTSYPYHPLIITRNINIISITLLRVILLKKN